MMKFKISLIALLSLNISYAMTALNDNDLREINVNSIAFEGSISAEEERVLIEKISRGEHAAAEVLAQLNKKASSDFNALKSNREIQDYLNRYTENLNRLGFNEEQVERQLESLFNNILDI